MGRSSRCRLSCALCIANRKGRSNFKGHYGYRPMPKPSFRSSVMGVTRRSKSSSETHVPGPEVTGVLPSKFPALWEFMSHENFDDGTARMTGSLSLFLDDGALKVALNDREEGYVAFVSGSSLEDVLGALEEGLTADSLDWRRSAFKKKKKW